MLAVVCIAPAAAQQDYSAHFIPDDWRAAYTNPALLPKGLYIALPGVYNNLLVTNLTYNDLVGTDETGASVVDVDAAIKLLGPDNTLRENLDIETIGVSFTLGAVTLSAGHRLRYSGYLNYPKTLPQLIWQGNAQFIGQTVDFSTDLDVLGYHELSIGAMAGIGEQLQLGGRVKLLSGIGSATTARKRLQLTTDEEIYELQLDADFRVDNSGAVRYDGLNDVSLDFAFGELTTDQLFSANSGVAFDIGAVLQLGKLRLTASALDIGGTINWDTDVRNYTIAGVSSFEGLDAAQAIFEDDTEFGDILDTLAQLYDPVETAESYTTKVGSKYYVSGMLDVTDKVTLGLLYFLENYRGENLSGIAASGSVAFTSFLRAGATYAWRNERFDNLGVNATVALGPVRLVLATDNIVTAFRPKDSHQANFRIGLGLYFPKAEAAEPTSLY